MPSDALLLLFDDVIAKIRSLYSVFVPDSIYVFLNVLLDLEHLHKAANDHSIHAIVILN